MSEPVEVRFEMFINNPPIDKIGILQKELHDALMEKMIELGLGDCQIGLSLPEVI